MRASLILTLALAASVVANVPAKAATRNADLTTATDGCMIVAELSMEAIERGALYVCLRSGNPIACAIAKAAGDVATSGVAKEGIERGCKWTVERVDRVIVFTVKSAKETKEEINRVYRTLDDVEGIIWLMKQLMQ